MDLSQTLAYKYIYCLYLLIFSIGFKIILYYFCAFNKLKPSMNGKTHDKPENFPVPTCVVSHEKKRFDNHIIFLILFFFFGSFSKIFCAKHGGLRAIAFPRSVFQSVKDYTPLFSRIALIFRLTHKVSRFF